MEWRIAFINSERYTDPYHFGNIIGDYTITNKIAVTDIEKENYLLHYQTIWRKLSYELVLFLSK